LLINSKKKEEDAIVIKKACPFIIMPHDKFKVFWNIVIITLLAYTATYMPYTICFFDDNPTGFLNVWENMVNILFFLDIIVNFCSAIEQEDGTPDPRLKSIAKVYSQTWFVLDLFAVFPT
jgi:hypothetical protein